MIAKKFPIWKTIKLGTFKTVEEMQNALREFNRRATEWLPAFSQPDYSLIYHPDFALAPAPTEVDVVRVTCEDLGFVDPNEHGKPLQCFHLSDLVARGRECGLIECPAEVGPQLRLQHEDQRDGESIEIVMAPLFVPNGQQFLHSVFVVDSTCVSLHSPYSHHKTLHPLTAGPRGEIGDERFFGNKFYLFMLPRQNTVVTT